MTTVSAAEMQAGAPLILEITEVISDPLRLQAYQQIASEMGDLVSVDVVAGEGDTVTLATPNGYRESNHRDLGDLLGVNLSDMPEEPGISPDEIVEFMLDEGQTAVIIKRPATFHPDSGRPLSSFRMPNFYRQTKTRYKALRNARKIAETALESPSQVP